MQSQLRVGGYLNLVFGNIEWFIIYFASGIFGNICSCIFLKDSVGVGSSGAVLGMLCSWLVWIIFRWKKVPRECKPQRNCQLLMVSAAVGITVSHPYFWYHLAYFFIQLAFSFSDYVDWAAHFGGSIQGFLLGGAFLSKELDNVYSKVRIPHASDRFIFFTFIYAVDCPDSWIWRLHISLYLVSSVYLNGAWTFKAGFPLFWREWWLELSISVLIFVTCLSYLSYLSSDILRDNLHGIQFQFQWNPNEFFWISVFWEVFFWNILRLCLFLDMKVLFSKGDNY